MTKRGLVMCRTGMGSSMMLRIKLEKVISKNKFPLELKHDVLSGFVILGCKSNDFIRFLKKQFTTADNNLTFALNKNCICIE